MDDERAMGQRLSAWLGEPVEVARLGEGHSNLTYLVSTAGRDLVVRRPPAGPLLPTAHDVLREYRVLELLAGSATRVRVPRVVAVCEDPAVLGVPFYLMERAVGDVVRQELPGWLAADPAARREVGLDHVRAYAEIHAVDPRPFVAAGLGRSGGYLERQLRRWTGQREGIEAAVAAAGGRARPLPDYDAVRDWLRDHRPEEQPSSVVHGDAKLDNVVVAPGSGRTPPHVVAVLDWEMATVGDPRADLGYLLSFWPEPGERHPLADQVSATSGFPARAELVAEWERCTGRVAGELTWFVTLGLWKLAVLLEASYHRYLAGTTDDPFFAALDEGVPALLARAREVSGA